VTTLVAAIVSLLLQAAPSAAFAAAAIKRGDPGNFRVRIGTSPRGGRFEAVNQTLAALVRFAYDVEEHQLIGASGWMTSERFDITATAGGDVPTPEMRAMLRTLLAERFALRVRRETRELPIYALEMARADRRPGPQLVPTRGDCSERKTCGITSGPDGLVQRARGGSVALARLPVFLKLHVRDRPIVDRTGLAGEFDFELRWTPDGQVTSDSAAPTLATALREQLGLRLAPGRGQVDVVVIESARRPMLD
jgi:uncharacterized protein (TIGR03435 family)